MKLNHIVLDILDWVRRVLWFNHNQAVKKKPYTILTTTVCQHGVLKLVERDTPRAVMTYIYTPKPVTKGNKVYNHKDYHICLDYLGALVDGKTRNKNIHRLKIGEASHSITVLESSRWVNKEGNYISNIVYHKNYDFLGDGKFNHRYAGMIFRDVCALLSTQKIEEFNWAVEIEWSKKLILP